MSANVISIYRKEYIKNRIKSSDPDQAHAAALESVQISLLYSSACDRMPVKEKDLALLQDLQTNPHYRRILEDITDLGESDQKQYLRQAAKVPALRLVK